MHGSVIASLTAVLAFCSNSAVAMPAAVEVAARTFPRAAPPRAGAVKSALPDDSGHTYYIGPWWFAPSGSIITSFVSTQSTPVAPPASDGGIAYVWPGLENQAEDFVLQNVIGNGQPAGEWTFATWYVGASEEMEYPDFEILDGDSIVSTFTLQDASTNDWVAAWQRTSNGAVTSGSIEQSFTESDVGALTNVLFSIELYSPATWDFGAVTWSDITIVANTTETDWCTSPLIEGGFSYSLSTPTATTNGDTTTCSISSLVFNSP